jgi:hypothetical protein
MKPYLFLTTIKLQEPGGPWQSTAQAQSTDQGESHRKQECPIEYA